ncbi:hypothetical protein [Clostridium sp. CF012]|uniref:hypothetical protein n=1 Tax=Clostridium sp. CF012 TaxID=2843319 RepID=UPI001C0B96AE|nr:hypothetical protein [Clostridium sp. CF012]MBU3144599.1 hypothetical protein [Clostridium sp. CF012]
MKDIVNFQMEALKTGHMMDITSIMWPVFTRMSAVPDYRNSNIHPLNFALNSS